jgi:hypothetical protein
MPRKKKAGKDARKIEPYQSTAEVMLKMIMESDKWLINNFKTSIYAWTIFILANTILTVYVWFILGFGHILSIILIFTLGFIWGVYLFVLYQTKIKIDSIKGQMNTLKKREEDFLKRF